jgi:hypothetical protein
VAEQFFDAFALFAISVALLWLLGAATLSEDMCPESLFRGPWLGCGILVGALQIVHLFVPITSRTSIILLAVLLGFALFRLVPQLLRKRQAAGELGSILLLLVLLAIAALLTFVPVFNSCSKDISDHDLGLYHLKTIRWIESFPIVPGLVNLQPHLGYNQSAFLLTSLVDTLVLNHGGISFVGGLLPWLGFLLSLFAIMRLAFGQFAKKPAAQPIEIAYAISLPAWIFVLVSGNSSSASPDSISFCLLLHLFLIFSCFIGSSDNPERSRNFGEILFLGATCLCVNPTSLAFVGGVVIACGVRVLFEKPGLQFLGDRRIVLMTALSALLLTTWSARGVILSGYPFFPSSAIGLRVPWRPPVKQVDSFRGMMVARARDPDPNTKIKTTLRTWRWLPSWFQRVHSSVDRWVWSIQVGLAGSVALLFAAAVGRLRRHLPVLVLLATPLLVHSVFWFLTVPEPKFFLLAAWLFALCPALTFLNRGRQVGFASGVANLCLNALPVMLVLWQFREDWSKPNISPFKFSVAETLPMTDPLGVKLRSPVENEQTRDSPSFGGQLPAPTWAFLQPEKGPAGGFKFLKVNASPEKNELSN